MSATSEDTKSLGSNLNNLSNVALADISSLNSAALNMALSRVLADSPSYPVLAPAPSFGSAI